MLNLNENPTAASNEKAVSRRWHAWLYDTHIAAFYVGSTLMLLSLNSTVIGDQRKSPPEFTQGDQNIAGTDRNRLYSKCQRRFPRATHAGFFKKVAC